MKLIDAIKEKGNPFWIPDCSRDDLPAFFVELGFEVGAEIGVSLATNLKEYCKVGLRMYGVDPWKEYDGFQYRPLGQLSKRYNRSIDNVYAVAVKTVAPYPNCTLIKKQSIDALAEFPRKSLDFVYIDANHDYGYVAMDLMKWVDKVRKGGVIAGHDYYSVVGRRNTRQVGPAVDGFMKAYDFSNWYVLGSKEPVEGERNDEQLSFMCFKHW